MGERTWLDAVLRWRMPPLCHACLTQVLEASWATLLEDASRAHSLNALMAAHSKYVEAIVEKACVIILFLLPSRARFPA